MKTYESICGADCAKCNANATCKGCVCSDGKPFGKPCPVAARYKKSEECYFAFLGELTQAVRDCGIEELKNLQRLFPMKAEFVNLEYNLPSGQKIKLWQDDEICLGRQIRRKNSDRFLGIAANENYLAISEYGENGTNAELLLFRRWRKEN